MSIIWWLLWGRWMFARWTRGVTTPRHMSNILISCHNNNYAGCRQYPFIYNDMCRILGRVR